MLLCLLAGTSVLGQTPGLILKPATGSGAALLDPDGDGYVSQKTGGVQLGFRTNDVTESEIPFVAIVRPDPLGDILRGPTGGFTEIVGTDAAGNNAILTYTDGINLFFRFRLSGYAPNSKSYSILVDTDQKFGFTGPGADPDALAGNAGFEVEIVLKTNFSVDVYNINGTTSGTLVSTQSYDTNCQKSIALSTASGNLDYFYDFFVPYPSLFTSTTALRYVALTGMSPSAATGSNSASDVGGVTSGAVSLDQAFTDLITVQTPTVPGSEVLDRSNCPAINGPISSGAISVSGSSADNGALIRLYVNDIQVGSTTVSGGNWNISGITPLVGGASVKATAQAAGKGESSATCNLTFVGSSCSSIPVVVSIDNGDKGGRVTNVASYPAGTVFTLLSAATNTEWVDSRDNNPYTITNTDITRGTIDIGCGGTGNCLNDGSYYIVAKAPGQCESQKAYFCVGSNISASSVPVIDSYIAPLSSYITGNNGVAGAVMYIYANGTLIGSKTLVSGGAWSVPVPNTLICNTTLTARQIASAQCISATSTGVNVGSAVTSAPTISINKCSTSITAVTGYSGESDGTTIQLYVNGGPRTGTATVSGGRWTFNTSPAITTGQIITARAINNSACKTISEYSAPVTLSGTTTLSGSYSIPSTIVEGASSVSVDVSGVTGTYMLNLYIDGDKIGSKSFTGSGTVVVPVTYASDIYTGGKLQVSLTQGTQCESALSAVLKTVECNTPSFTNCVISTPLTNKCVTTSGTISITNSQSGVIYTPIDASNVVKGYSTLGTGGTIALTTYAFPTSGPATFYVRAQRIVPSGTCEARSVASVSFNAFSPPQFNTHPASKIVCSGESTTLTASWNGIGPYHVQWQYNNGGGFVDISNGGIYSQASVTGLTATAATLNISNVTGLDNYTFRCIVTDTSVPSDCQSNASNIATLSVPLVTITNAMVTNATMGNNGSVSITVSGGSAPYLYDWHHLNGPGTFGEVEDLTGLTEGNYTVTVMDANGCSYQQTFIVGGISSINLAMSSKSNVTCFGDNNGSFTVTASSGTAPYAYSIDNFANTQPSGTFSNLPPGSYIVKARDAGSRISNTVLITITEPAEMVVSAVISNPSILQTDGSLHFSLEGGTPSFSYSLYKVGTPDVLIPGNADNGRTKSYSGLSAGTYYINIRDANGCIASKTNIVLTAPVVQSVQCSHTASHSFNDNSISGYDGDYNYFTSDWIESPMRNEIGLYENALAFGKIPAVGNDTYSWGTTSSIYRMVDLQGATNIVLSYKVQAYNASNQDNFTVQLIVNDAIQATYNMANSYQYSTSSTVTLNNIPFNTLNGNSLNKIEFRISAGQSRSNLRIDDVSLSFNKGLSVGVVAVPATCNNGKVDLSVVGGYSPYFYDWDNDGTGDFDDTQDLSGLAPGTYKVTVKDSRNCTYSQLTAIVGNAPLTAGITSSINPTCVGGGSNGSVTTVLSATGGGGPFIYQLYKASELVLTVYSAFTSKTFTGLTPGTYYIRVTQSADNCSVQTAPVTLSMPVLTTNLAAAGATTLCSGSSTNLKVDITGGTAPYTILLSDGQSIANYTSGTAITVTPLLSTTYTVVGVTDAFSCVSSSNTGSVAVTVNPSLPVSVSISASPSGAICAGTSVTFTATTLNAGANPTYTWIVGSSTVGSNSPIFTSGSLTNGNVVTCTVTKDPSQVCMTGSPASSNSIVMSVTAPPEAAAGTDITTCSTYGAVNITAGASASNYASINWTSSGTGTFTNANSLTTATYTPSNNDIVAGSVILTLTAYANSPCSNAVATKTLTITPGHYADFSYTGSPYCSNQTNPYPTFNGGGVAGIFSSTPGLVFIDTSTGQVNLSASAPGEYTVTNIIAASGGCSTITASSTITILPEGSWTGAVDQDWNNPGNWACNQLPTLVTNVTIANDMPRYPILSNGDPGKAYHITIESNASVTVVGNILQIAGAIYNNGTFTSTEGTIEMKGSVAQTIGANIFATNTLMNLIINNASGVSLLGALNITGVVSPVMGNFNAGGHLTLLSTASQTALIDGSGSGNVTGNVNMQRYLPSSFGYKYFSSPFQSATVAELADEVNLTETFPNFYKYDENHSRDSVGITVYYSGWTNYTTSSNPLVPLYGYAANMGTSTSPVTVTMSGEVNNGNLNTTLFNNNRKYTRGFNLVGNPYPSPIDWDAAGWTKTNIDNALYFFNAGSTDRYTGVYSSYVNGVATGNANNVIAAMQGFFVHVSDGSYPITGTLGVSNAVRINNLNPVFKTAVIDNRPTLRLKAAFGVNNAIEDAAVVYFDAQASAQFEKQMDALKMVNTDEQVPNIYTIAPDRQKLSINGLSEPADNVCFIPVGITTLIDGTLSIKAENASELPFLQVYLADALTGKYHDLRQSPEMRFSLQRGVYDSRFKLVFSKSSVSWQYPEFEKMFTVTRSSNRVLVKVNLETGIQGNLTVTNTLGQALYHKQVVGKETVEIGQDVTTGVYVITLVSGKRSVSEKILMRQDYE